MWRIAAQRRKFHESRWVDLRQIRKQAAAPYRNYLPQPSQIPEPKIKGSGGDVNDAAILGKGRSATRGYFRDKGIVPIDALCRDPASRETSEWWLVCGVERPKLVARRTIMCLYAKAAGVGLHRHYDRVLSSD